MDSVDYDVRQQILLKASRQILGSEVTADAYTRLASVCGRFYTVVRQKRFADSIKQTVKGFSPNIFIVIIIIINNNIMVVIIIPRLIGV